MLCCLSVALSAKSRFASVGGGNARQSYVFLSYKKVFPAFFLRWVLLIPTAKITLMWVDVLLSFGFFSV